MFKKKHVKINYNKITDYLFVGSNACCRVHFDEGLIKKEGIEADVSIEDERVDAPFGLKFFLWLPTKDDTPPTQEQLLAGVRFIKQMVDAKKSVYVHCRNGHGRAPTVATAYLVYSGMSIDDALALIKKQRPEVHMEDSQIAAVKKFVEIVNE